MHSLFDNIMKTHFNDKDKKIKTSNGKNLGGALEKNKQDSNLKSNYVSEFELD